MGGQRVQRAGPKRHRASEKTRRHLVRPRIRGDARPIDTKVSINTIVQWIDLDASGVIASVNRIRLNGVELHDKVSGVFPICFTFVLMIEGAGMAPDSVMPRRL